MMNRIGTFLLTTTCLLLSLPACQSQSPTETPSPPTGAVVGGPFENDHLLYVGMPEQIASIDTSAGWDQAGERLLITGTILQADGKTPAPGVILYYYHTDVHGRYPDRPDLDPQLRPHGYIRGWVRSDDQGRYAIYTIRPGAYPGRNTPAHIHPAIKEPNVSKEYYIDEFVFDDDPLLTTEQRKAMQNRGGSGILRLVKQGDLHIAEHNIILGLNIPNYPKQKAATSLRSGREIGEDVFSFTPYHAWGPDQGKKTCPICKYGWYQGILYFVGDRTDWNDVRQWLDFLEAESIRRDKLLKVYFVYGSETDYQKDQRIQQLEQLGQSLGLEHVALTFVPSFTDRQTEVYLNEINPVATNTFLIYRRSNIVDKYVNLPATSENFELLSRRLDATQADYLDVPQPRYE